MTDIHAHILPWIDDGAENMDHAVEMARIAETEGITSICVTPHCNIPRQYENYFGEYYKELFLHTKREFQRMRLSVNLYPGMEVFATPDLPNLIASGKILTLNQSRYLLVEFDFFEDPEFVFAILEKIREMKLIPIVAHPERYEFVQEDPQNVYEMHSRGYLIQMNKGSMEGCFGSRVKNTAYKLLRHGLVSVIATDAHGTEMRSPRINEARRITESLVTKEYANILFCENPKRICANSATFRFKAIPFA